MHPRNLVASLALAGSLSCAVACEPSLSLTTRGSPDVAEVRAAYEDMSVGLRSSIGAFDVSVFDGPITLDPALAYLRGEPAFGAHGTWDEVPMAYDPASDRTFVSVPNTRAYFRGFSALEEEAWHAFDARTGISRNETFRMLAEPQTRFFTEENYGPADEDRIYAEIFADFADAFTDPDGDLLRRSYPALTAWYDALFTSLDQRAKMCNPLKPGA